MSVSEEAVVEVVVLGTLAEVMNVAEEVAEVLERGKRFMLHLWVLH